jgi:hypothetical protein
LHLPLAPTPTPTPPTTPTQTTKTQPTKHNHYYSQEYLLFRGFTDTLAAFSADVAADRGGGFQAAAIAHHVFNVLLPALDGARLVDFLDFLNQRCVVV